MYLREHAVFFSRSPENTNAFLLNIIWYKHSSCFDMRCNVMVNPVKRKPLSLCSQCNDIVNIYIQRRKLFCRLQSFIALACILHSQHRKKLQILPKPFYISKAANHFLWRNVRRAFFSFVHIFQL